MHLRKQLEKNGKTKAELDEQFSELESPVLSAAARYLINIFSELSTARQSGMSGPLPISFSEIKAYNELTDAELEPWEVDAIRLMDRTFLDEVAQILNKDKKK